ncbi:hypothetical protein PENTCL1PPCAC_19287, partial [Pristionchus entomophagus]
LSSPDTFPMGAHDVNAHDHLSTIDEIIGFPYGIGPILAVLEELDTKGLSVRDGFGTAPDPCFSRGAESAILPLQGMTSVESPMGARMLMFWSAHCAFSNFHPAPITIDGHFFLSSEHYFMWAKAKTFNDEQMAEEILWAETPADAKKLGRGVANFRKDVWGAGKSVRMMTIACYRKFQQNPLCRKALLSTEGTVLVEAWPDKIWSNGIDPKHPGASHPANWEGTNCLGRILTVIREHMISSKIYEDEL